MTTQDPLRLTDVDPLVLTVPARAGQLALALLLDLLVPLACAVAAALFFVSGSPGTGWMLTLAAVVILALLTLQVARTGQSLGRAAVGIRTVNRSSGVAAGKSLLPALFSGGLRSFDIRRGRDPFAPALAPFQFPERPVPPPLPRRGSRSRVPVVHLDSGQRIPLESALILGRNPSAPADAPAEVYQWPDLSRTLSKSHVRLEWDGARVWVTDLGSTNGTLIRSAGAAEPLLAHQRTPLPAGVTLEVGDRIVTIGGGA